MGNMMGMSGAVKAMTPIPSDESNVAGRFSRREILEARERAHVKRLRRVAVPRIQAEMDKRIGLYQDQIDLYKDVLDKDDGTMLRTCRGDAWEAIDILTGSVEALRGMQAWIQEEVV